jgi:IS1 family transposase
MSFQDKYLRNLPCKRVQCDEIWSFVYSKDKNVSKDNQGIFGFGDVWTWVAIEAQTKLVPCWHVGSRDGGAAKAFIDDLASRLKNRVQLTTDGHKAFLNAVEDSFGAGIDYAMLVKLYGNASGNKQEKRYSAGECCGAIKCAVCGIPDEKHVSTSFVEHRNLTMRMSMRRFTRLTNAFSKKLENHMYAISLHYMYYNFGRIHQSLRVTPAMEAGVTDHLWSLEDIARLVKDDEPKKYGPYKKRNSN